MGFYGNIKNTSRTQFSFDKIYPNRAALDGRGNDQKTGAAVDDIYAGRFVLVEYDSNVTEDQFIRAFLWHGVLYSTIPNSANGTLIPIRIYEEVEENPKGANRDNYYLIKGMYNFDEQIVNEDGSITYPKDRFVQLLGTNDVKKDEFYYTYNAKNNTLSRYTVINDEGEISTPIQESFLYAAFKDVPWSTEDNNYFKNYNIDIGIYGVSRGYDSTVWQKVYTNGIPKYVMVAELNSVVPTFDLAADAPSVFPNIPHFDSDSTNVYYRLHWQPQWGMRLKASNPALRTPFLKPNGEAYSSTGSTEGTALTRQNDIRQYPSDETTTWTHSVFDNNNQFQKMEYFIPDNGNGTSTWGDKDTAAMYEPLGAAVYYNKAGFNPEKITYSEDTNYEGWDNNTVTDEISITPTGVSGHQYKSHNPIERESIQPDIQELSIMLPSVGDTMAAVWDVVYGGRNIDPDAKTRNMDIAWYNAKAVSNKQGLRLVEPNGPGHYTYNPKNAATLAGILNSAQDLMGMIITDDMPETAEGVNDQYIYYDSETQKYYFKHKTFEYTTKYTGIDGDEYPNEIPGDYNPYNPVALKKWDNGYFYVDTASKAGTEYIMENKFYSDRKYLPKGNVEACMSPIFLSKEYRPDGTFYYRSSDQYLSTVPGVKGSTYRYLVASTESYDPTKTYYEFTKAPDSEQIPAGEAIYIPNTYYTEEYNIVTLTADTYEPDLYYIRYAGDNGAVFYFKISIPEDSFRANWLEIVDSDLIISTSPSTFKIRKPLQEEVFFKREYTLDTNLNVSDGKKYYRLKTTSGGSNAYYKQIKTAEPALIDYDNYMPDKYYYLVQKENADGTEENINGTLYKLDTNTYADENEFNSTGHKYYSIKIRYELVQGPDIIDINDENVEEVTKMHNITEFKSGDYSLGTGKDLFYIYVDAVGSTRYIEVNYNNFSKSYNDSTKRYELVVMNYSKIGSPYHKNQYYYQVIDTKNEKYGSYLIDNNENLTVGRTYYKFQKPDNLTDADLIPHVLTGYFAENKFYIEYPEGSGLYIPADKYNENQNQYYDRNNLLYVEDDSEGIYTKGAEWPMEVKKLPIGVKLATRKDKWEFQDLNGFSDKLNTMYGALLRLQQTLNEQDSLTRDSSSIRGSINLINDITHRFSRLIPGQFTIVDDYGRMHSAELTTAQGLKYAGQVGDKKTDMAKKEEAENTLVTIDINSDYKNPAISIIHTKPEKIESTTGTTDLNNRDNDTITLQTFVYDDAGHVAAEHNETYTLPYGFKAVNIVGSTAETELTTNTTGIVADNSKDTMTLAAANKWIKLAGTDGTSNKIEIAHALVSASFGEKKDNSQDTTPAFGEKFKVPVITTDNAGHVIAFETEEVKIPGWTFEDNHSPNTADIVLDVTYTYDTANDIGTLTKTRGNVDNLLIQDYVIDGVASAKLAKTDSIHSAFAKLQAQINGMDLSKVGGGEGEYITDITEIDGIVTANKAILPSVNDTAKDGSFVSSVSEKYGAITVTRTELQPSLTIGAGTINTAPTIQITVNTKTSGDPVALTIATTGIYGVTKLTDQFIASDTTLALTGKALQAAITGLKVDDITDLAANKTITAISQTDGKISVSAQDIEIETSQVTGLDDSITSLNNSITDINKSMAGINESIITINNSIGSAEDDETINSLYGLIKSLQVKITALEAKIDKYHPGTETNPEETPTE